MEKEGIYISVSVIIYYNAFLEITSVKFIAVAVAPVYGVIQNSRGKCIRLRRFFKGILILFGFRFF